MEKAPSAEKWDVEFEVRNRGGDRSEASWLQPFKVFDKRSKASNFLNRYRGGRLKKIENLGNDWVFSSKRIEADAAWCKFLDMLINSQVLVSTYIPKQKRLKKVHRSEP